MNVIGDCEVVDDDNERPDILIRCGYQLIGVEVTKCYSRVSDEDTSARTENTLNRVVEEAVKTYNESGGTPLTFGVVFNGNTSLGERKSLTMTLSRFLSGWVGSSKIDPFTPVVTTAIDRDAFPELSAVNCIVAQSTGAEESVGFVASGFHSTTVNDSVLKEIIGAKATLLNEYKKRCSEVWLLISLPFLYLATDYSLPRSEVITGKKGFDRIFVLDVYRNKYHEIMGEITEQRA